MTKEIDSRDHNISRITPARERELHNLAASVSGLLAGTQRISIRDFDALTGNPAAVNIDHAPARSGDYVERARQYLNQINRALGLTVSQPVEFVPDPDYQTTSTGAVSVHFTQQHRGIPIFGAAETVRFDPGGALQEAVGRSVTVNGDPDAATAISVSEAVLIAAKHAAAPDANVLAATDQFGQPMQNTGVDLGDFEPEVIATFTDTPERKTVLDAGPFGDSIKASLCWFPLHETLRLCWDMLLTLPDYAGQYRVLVDASYGEILYAHQQMNFIVARGNVYRRDGGSARVMTDFPRDLADYPLPAPNDLPNGFPDDWVSEDNTIGNSTNAHLGVAGSSGQGSLQGNVLTFDPSSASGDEQKVLNIFYYNCVMHDYFYLLGFREEHGNFQRDNFGRGGLATDRVDARAHSGVVQGTANMATPADGNYPIMNMGLVSSTNRHTAFDSSVVFHEFTHGVTNRLVGGPANAYALDDDQSGGMGEGWSDYFACTVNGSVVVGDWVVNDPDGIRKFPYDSNFPDNFGDLGSGRYSGVTSSGDYWPHPIGEIWCATLLEMNRNIGTNLGAQLVVDALKLTAANPGFLDARDAILTALDHMLASGKLNSTEHQASQDGVWQAFAKFGMGPNAQSNGAFLTGIVPDFNVPGASPQPTTGADVSVDSAPNVAIPDNQADGISDVIPVAESGRITRLDISVDITHSYIGDLRLSLTSPGGVTVILHNRNGGSANDLNQTYRSDHNAELQTLLDNEAQGDWILQVADLARFDVGVLRQWGMEMDLQSASSTAIRQKVEPALAIPDKNPKGISSSMTISESGTAQTIKLSVDITHTYIGDLRVELVNPGGDSAIVHNRFGGSADNLITTYDSITNAALDGLTGQPIQGEWTLKVSDLAGQDVGKLNAWQLEITR